LLLYVLQRITSAKAESLKIYYGTSFQYSELLVSVASVINTS